MGKTTSIRGVGETLEKVVLFRESPLKISHPVQGSTHTTTTIQEEDEEHGRINKLCWWNPSEDLLPVEFCRNSSIHGLSFIGRRGLHLSERIFWTIAFILGVVAAVFLINDVWKRYNQNPVIVAFQSMEVDISNIPFPSVTICSMNAFPRSQVNRLQKVVASMSGTEEARAAREALKYVREICNSQLSFSKEFQFAHSRGEEEMNLGWNETIAENTQSEMMDFLMKYTLPCESIIRLCMFAEKAVECDTIFKPLITDYGKCCTFNILPLPLLRNNPQTTLTSTEESTESVEHNHSDTNISQFWSNEELDEWRNWNYDKDGFILSNNQTRPYRQKRAGMPYGLSILVDPNLLDWHCPVSDSEGLRFLLHNSLEMPYVDEFASMIQLNQEILVEIHPEMTNADDDIRDFKREFRNCYYPEERQLQFFGPYTSNNCIAECTALMFERKCNCTYFYMPRNANTQVCNSNPQSIDYKCMDNAKRGFLEALKTECSYCDSLCEDIEYHFETTTAKLQDASSLWGDPDPTKHTKPPWAKNEMSIIHIFLGSETIVPKLRKRMYGTTDLIANTGGLLGLCLGFSVLSAVEIIYFLTLRIFWRICLKRKAKGNKKIKKYNNERIIQLNPNQIPVVRGPIHQAWKEYPGPTHPYYITTTDLINKKGL